MTINTKNSNDWEAIITDEKERLQRYLEVNLQKTPYTEDDQNFLTDILDEAINNTALGAVLNEIDNFIISELPEELKSEEAYLNKQPWLAEYLVCVDPDFSLLLQKHLSTRRLYDGPIDGIYGKHTREAVNKFKQEASIDEPELGPKTMAKILAEITEITSAKEQEASIDEPELGPKTTARILAEITNIKD